MDLGNRDGIAGSTVKIVRIGSNPPTSSVTTSNLDDLHSESSGCGFTPTCKSPVNPCSASFNSEPCRKDTLGILAEPFDTEQLSEYGI